MEHVAPAVMNGELAKMNLLNLHLWSELLKNCCSGGFSTMLALSLLVTSQSHIFISFFKVISPKFNLDSFFFSAKNSNINLQIFFMICIFGLFHGLILLPVVLCLLGPIENEDEKVSRSPIF